MSVTVWNINCLSILVYQLSKTCFTCTKHCEAFTVNNLISYWLLGDLFSVQTWKKSCYATVITSGFVDRTIKLADPINEISEASYNFYESTIFAYQHDHSIGFVPSAAFLFWFITAFTKFTSIIIGNSSIFFSNCSKKLAKLKSLYTNRQMLWSFTGKLKYACIHLYTSIYQSELK